MNEVGIKIVIDAFAWLVAASVIINLAFFFANLKLYTEIMKEISEEPAMTHQREARDPVAEMHAKAVSAFKKWEELSKAVNPKDEIQQITELLEQLWNQGAWKEDWL